MLYTLTIESDTRTSIVVDPEYQPVPRSSCMGFVHGLNCPRYAGETIHVNGSEYIAAETYCDAHIAEGILNLLAPEPGECPGGCHPSS